MGVGQLGQQRLPQQPQVPPESPVPGSDYLIKDHVCPPPVGGTAFVASRSMARNLARRFYSFHYFSRYRISLVKDFPGVLREVTVVSKEGKICLAILSEIRDLLSKRVIVQIDVFPSFCLSPIFVITKCIGDL